MNAQSVGYKVKAFGARKLAFLFLVIMLLLPGYREVLDELAALGSVMVPNPVVSEAGWLANGPDSVAWSPVHAIEEVRIPVLYTLGSTWPYNPE